MSILFGAYTLPFNSPPPLGREVFFLEEVLLNLIGASVAILISIIITAFFVPNMLRKGTVELLLVKPIRRWTLLLYKYLGGLTFISLNTLYAVGGVWLVFGLRAGLWSPRLFMVALITLGYFALLYAVSTLVAVLTRSTVVAILLSCSAWFLFVLVGIGYHQVDDWVKDGRLAHDSWIIPAMNGLHYVLPRPKDLDRLSNMMLAHDLDPQLAALEKYDNVAPVNWRESLTVTGMFLFAMMAIACIKFSTADF
jgi:hypothetical protein